MRKSVVRRAVDAAAGDFPDDYFDPKQPLGHKIAAREQGILEEVEMLGRPEYAIIKDGYKYRLVDHHGARRKSACGN